MHFETSHNEIEYVLSVKESNFNEKKIKIFTFAYSHGRGGWPFPPNSQPDNKISASYDAFPQASRQKKRIFYGQADLRVAPSLTVSVRDLFFEVSKKQVFFWSKNTALSPF